MTKTRWLTKRQQQTWRSYLRMQTELSAALNRQLLNESELSLADFEVLVRLTDVPTGQLRVVELARTLKWEQSRLSHHIARMQRRGLVARRECTEDGRGWYVTITEQGRRAIEAAAPRHVDLVRRVFFDDLTNEQLDALHSLSEKVLDRLADESGKAG